MREIKFRGLSIESLEWFVGDLIHLDNKVLIAGRDMSAGEFRNGHIELEAFSVHPPSIGQYIGLKDKNEVEIYEGDILKTEQGMLKVIWDYTAACYWGIDNYGEEVYQLSIELDLEIIGNIHQNPELL